MNSRPLPSVSRRSLILGGAALPLLASSTASRAAASNSATANTAENGGMKVQKLAWAGVKLEIGNVALFIDAIAPDPEGGQPGPALETQTALRYALVSHNHLDHYDPVALKPILGARGLVAAHEDVVRLFHDRSVNVQPVRYHEPVFFSRGGGEFAARCVPAADGLGSPQTSWIVDGNGRKIIHCGDTSWHGGWWDIARAYGPFDAAFLPINGFQQTTGRFQNVSQPMSLTPEQAVTAARILKPGVVIPIHYGSSGNPAYVETPEALAVFLKLAAAQGVKTRVLAPGENWTL